MNERAIHIGSFTEEVLPHLDAAYNLARWLTRNAADADDIVQEAYLRAFRYFDGFQGGNARAWLLTIVRNTSYAWLRKNRAQQPDAEFDEAIHNGPEAADPETLMLQKADCQLVEQAIRALPEHFREVLVLRELEGLTYKQIADVVGVPIGTVMSSLSRARDRFRNLVSEEFSRTPTRSAAVGDPHVDPSHRAEDPRVDRGSSVSVEGARPFANVVPRDQSSDRDHGRAARGTDEASAGSSRAIVVG
jgi:RNA polymerase sigma-70 factor (ECF subfamily)